MYSREENLKRVKKLKEKSINQFNIRKTISYDLDYKDNDFGVIVSNDNPVIILIDDNDINSQDYMRIHVSRYDSKENVLYEMSYKDIESSLVDFLLSHPRALEYIIENKENYKNVIEYLKLYFIHNDKNYNSMIRYITRLLDVMNPIMIKFDDLKFNEEAEKILLKII
ncbi:hypothetical protein [Clostridium perfringens]|uniref:hypothetical protein n=1 Tax=Clostridium perfringens TaxID=1502 RepID=UPI00096A7ECE|nr:hypothetical protein [Clostridium perfringens]